MKKKAGFIAISGPTNSGKSTLLRCISRLTDATKGKMVYPSLDPSIFEVKFPNKDLKGRVV